MRNLPAQSIPLTVSLAFALNCPAALADIPAPPSQMKKSSGRSVKQFATLSVQEKRIAVLAENAKVEIVRHKLAHEIIVSSDSPGNWSVQNGLIRQAVVAGRKGVDMTRDALGVRAIMNGLVYTLPAGKIRDLKMTKEGVFINGEKMQPLKGNGIPKLEGEVDTLQVIVPESYAGGLSVGCAGKSEVQLSGWKGGDVKLTLVGESSISAGRLSAINKAVVDNRGQGRANIGGINAKILVANIAGKGSVMVGDGSAEISNATVTGMGTMTLKGDFKNLKQAVEGNGKIEVIK